MNVEDSLEALITAIDVSESGQVINTKKAEVLLRLINVLESCTAPSECNENWPLFQQCVVKLLQQTCSFTFSQFLAVAISRFCALARKSQSDFLSQLLQLAPAASSSNGPKLKNLARNISLVASMLCFLHPMEFSSHFVTYFSLLSQYIHSKDSQLKTTVIQSLAIFLSASPLDLSTVLVTLMDILHSAFQNGVALLNAIICMELLVRQNPQLIAPSANALYKIAEDCLVEWGWGEKRSRTEKEQQKQLLSDGLVISRLVSLMHQILTLPLSLPSKCFHQSTSKMDPTASWIAQKFYANYHQHQTLMQKKFDHHTISHQILLQCIKNSVLPSPLLSARLSLLTKFHISLIHSGVKSVRYCLGELLNLFFNCAVNGRAGERENLTGFDFTVNCSNWGDNFTGCLVGETANEVTDMETGWKHYQILFVRTLHAAQKLMLETCSGKECIQKEIITYLLEEFETRSSISDPQDWSQALVARFALMLICELLSSLCHQWIQLGYSTNLMETVRNELVYFMTSPPLWSSTQVLHSVARAFKTTLLSSDPDLLNSTLSSLLAHATVVHAELRTITKKNKLGNVSFFDDHYVSAISSRACDDLSETRTIIAVSLATACALSMSPLPANEIFDEIGDAIVLLIKNSFLMHQITWVRTARRLSACILMHAMFAALAKHKRETVMREAIKNMASEFQFLLQNIFDVSTLRTFEVAFRFQENVRNAQRRKSVDVRNNSLLVHGVSLSSADIPFLVRSEEGEGGEGDSGKYHFTTSPSANFAIELSCLVHLISGIAQSFEFYESYFPDYLMQNVNYSGRIFAAVIAIYLTSKNSETEESIFDALHNFSLSIKKVNLDFTPSPGNWNLQETDQEFILSVSHFLVSVASLCQKLVTCERSHTLQREFFDGFISYPFSPSPISPSQIFDFLSEFLMHSSPSLSEVHELVSPLLSPEDMTSMRQNSDIEHSAASFFKHNSSRFARERYNLMHSEAAISGAWERSFASTVSHISPNENEILMRTALPSFGASYLFDDSMNVSHPFVASHSLLLPLQISVKKSACFLSTFLFLSDTRLGENPSQALSLLSSLLQILMPVSQQKNIAAKSAASNPSGLLKFLGWGAETANAITSALSSTDTQSKYFDAIHKNSNTLVPFHGFFDENSANSRLEGEISKSISPIYSLLILSLLLSRFKCLSSPFCPPLYPCLCAGEDKICLLCNNERFLMSLFLGERRGERERGELETQLQTFISHLFLSYGYYANAANETVRTLLAFTASLHWILAANYQILYGADHKFAVRTDIRFVNLTNGFLDLGLKFDSSSDSSRLSFSPSPPVSSPISPASISLSPEAKTSLCYLITFFLRYSTSFSIFQQNLSPALVWPDIACSSERKKEGEKGEKKELTQGGEIERRDIWQGEMRKMEEVDKERRLQREKRVKTIFSHSTKYLMPIILRSCGEVEARTIGERLWCLLRTLDETDELSVEYARDSSRIIFAQVFAEHQYSPFLHEAFWQSFAQSHHKFLHQNSVLKEVFDKFLMILPWIASNIGPIISTKSSSQWPLQHLFRGKKTLSLPFSPYILTDAASERTVALANSLITPVAENLFSLLLFLERVFVESQTRQVRIKAFDQLRTFFLDPSIASGVLHDCSLAVKKNPRKKFRIKFSLIAQFVLHVICVHGVEMVLGLGERDNAYVEELERTAEKMMSQLSPLFLSPVSTWSKDLLATSANNANDSIELHETQTKKKKKISTRSVKNWLQVLQKIATSKSTAQSTSVEEMGEIGERGEEESGEIERRPNPTLTPTPNSLPAEEGVFACKAAAAFKSLEEDGEGEGEEEREEREDRKSSKFDWHARSRTLAVKLMQNLISRYFTITIKDIASKFDVEDQGEQILMSPNFVFTSLSPFLEPSKISSCHFFAPMRVFAPFEMSPLQCENLETAVKFLCRLVSSETAPSVIHQILLTIEHLIQICANASPSPGSTRDASPFILYPSDTETETRQEMETETETVAQQILSPPVVEIDTPFMPNFDAEVNFFSNQKLDNLAFNFPVSTAMNQGGETGLSPPPFEATFDVPDFSSAQFSFPEMQGIFTPEKKESEGEEERERKPDNEERDRLEKGEEERRKSIGEDFDSVSADGQSILIDNFAVEVFQPVSVDLNEGTVRSNFLLEEERSPTFVSHPISKDSQDQRGESEADIVTSAVSETMPLKEKLFDKVNGRREEEGEEERGDKKREVESGEEQEGEREKKGTAEEETEKGDGKERGEGEKGEEEKKSSFLLLPPRGITHAVEASPMSTVVEESAFDDAESQFYEKEKEKFEEALQERKGKIDWERIRWNYSQSISVANDRLANRVGRSYFSLLISPICLSIFDGDEMNNKEFDALRTQCIKIFGLILQEGLFAGGVSRISRLLISPIKILMEDVKTAENFSMWDRKPIKKISRKETENVVESVETLMGVVSRFCSQRVRLLRASFIKKWSPFVPSSAPGTALRTLLANQEVFDEINEAMEREEIDAKNTNDETEDVHEGDFFRQFLAKERGEGREERGKRVRAESVRALHQNLIHGAYFDQYYETGNFDGLSLNREQFLLAYSSFMEDANVREAINFFVPFFLSFAVSQSLNVSDKFDESELQILTAIRAPLSPSPETYQFFASFAASKICFTAAPTFDFIKILSAPVKKKNKSECVVCNAYCDFSEEYAVCKGEERRGEERRGGKGKKGATCEKGRNERGKLYFMDFLDTLLAANLFFDVNIGANDLMSITILMFANIRQLRKTHGQIFEETAVYLWCASVRLLSLGVKLNIFEGRERFLDDKIMFLINLWKEAGVFDAEEKVRTIANNCDKLMLSDTTQEFLTLCVRTFAQRRKGAVSEEKEGEREASLLSKSVEQFFGEYGERLVRNNFFASASEAATQCEVHEWETRLERFGAFSSIFDPISSCVEKVFLFLMPRVLEGERYFFDEEIFDGFIKCWKSFVGRVSKRSNYDDFILRAITSNISEWHRLTTQTTRDGDSGENREAERLVKFLWRLEKLAQVVETLLSSEAVSEEDAGEVALSTQQNLEHQLESLLSSLSLYSSREGEEEKREGGDEEEERRGEERRGEERRGEVILEKIQQILVRIVFAFKKQKKHTTILLFFVKKLKSDYPSLLPSKK